LGGRKEPKNISLLPQKKHQAWHFLFMNYTPERIVDEINDKYLDPDYILIVQRRT
jgi:hypothetical protein